MPELPRPSYVGTGRRSDGMALDRTTGLLLRVLTDLHDRHAGLHWSAAELVPFVQSGAPFAAMESTRTISSRFHPLERHGFIAVAPGRPKAVAITEAGYAHVTGPPQ